MGNPRILLSKQCQIWPNKYPGMLHQQPNESANVAGCIYHLVVDTFDVNISTGIYWISDRQAIVVIQDPTQHLSTLDDPCILRFLIWNRHLLPNPLMWTGFIVVADVLLCWLESSSRYFGIFDANFVRSRLCLLTGPTLNDAFIDNKLFIGGLYKIGIVFGWSIWAVYHGYAIPWYF